MRLFATINNGRWDGSESNKNTESTTCSGDNIVLYQGSCMIETITSSSHNSFFTKSNTTESIRYQSVEENILVIMSSLDLSMQSLSLHENLNAPVSYDFDCSAFDTLASCPLAPIQEGWSNHQSAGRRSSISRSQCVRNLSSLAGSSCSSNSSAVSLSSQSSLNQGACQYGYFVDSVSN